MVRVNPVRFGARVTGELLADFGCDARVRQPGNKRMPQPVKCLAVSRATFALSRYDSAR